MKKKKFFIVLFTLILTLSQSMTVFAITESDVEAIGKETAAGNIFIWFLCAIAFLKISQKIDSFMNKKYGGTRQLKAKDPLLQIKKSTPLLFFGFDFLFIFDMTLYMNEETQSMGMFALSFIVSQYSFIF